MIHYHFSVRSQKRQKKSSIKSFLFFILDKNKCPKSEKSFKFLKTIFPKSTLDENALISKIAQNKL